MAPPTSRSDSWWKLVRLERSVRVGDLLTSCSIAISIVALVLTWSHQIRLQEREQANRTRSAAAEILAKLERWQSISLGLFDGVQSEYVATSEFLKEERNVIAARDRLWRELNAIHQDILQRYLQEDIESAYIGIYAFRPRLRDMITHTRAELDAAEDVMFENLLAATEQRVLSFQNKLDSFRTAELGNELRAVTRELRSAYVEQLGQIMRPLNDALLAIIIADDNEVLEAP